MRIAALLVVAACAAHPIEIHAPVAIGDRGVDWVVTEPTLHGSIHVAAPLVGDASYVLECGIGLNLVKLIEGRVAWAKRVLPTCYSHGEKAVPIAVLGDRVVIAAVDEIAPWVGGVRIIAVDAEGRAKWTRVLQGQARGLGLADGPERIAVWFQAHGNVTLDGGVVGAPGSAIAIELDHAGNLRATHEIANGWGVNGSFSYDDTGALWAIVAAGDRRPLRVDGRDRPLAHGTYALRLDTLRAVPLATRGEIIVKPQRAGFVVEHWRDHALEFYDLDGKQRWRIAADERGCAIHPSAIAATPTRLVASVPVRCDQVSGAAGFGDVAITADADRDEKIASHAVIVDLAMPAAHARHVIELAHVDADTDIHFTRNDEWVIAYGAFAGRLGLGTDIHSGPPSYECDSDDARTSDDDEPERRCRHREATDPSWPFVAGFSLPP